MLLWILHSTKIKLLKCLLPFSCYILLNRFNYVDFYYHSHTVVVIIIKSAPVVAEPIVNFGMDELILLLGPSTTVTYTIVLYTTRFWILRLDLLVLFFRYLLSCLVAYSWERYRSPGYNFVFYPLTFTSVLVLGGPGLLPSFKRFSYSVLRLEFVVGPLFSMSFSCIST